MSESKRVYINIYGLSSDGQIDTGCAQAEDMSVAFWVELYSKSVHGAGLLIMLYKRRRLQA